MAGKLTKTLGMVSALGIGATGVSGCSGGDGGVATVAPPPPSPAAMGAERFGTGFALSFRAAASTDPREPMQADLIPASLSTDPLDVP